MVEEPKENRNYLSLCAFDVLNEPFKKVVKCQTVNWSHGYLFFIVQHVRCKDKGMIKAKIGLSDMFEYCAKTLMYKTYPWWLNIIGKKYNNRTTFANV